MIEVAFRGYGTQNLETKKHLKRADRLLVYFESEVISNNW